MDSEDRGDGWIILNSGIKFYPLSPRKEEVNIEDIVLSLSRLPRYTAHTTYFYSVGLHSCLVADWLYTKFSDKKLSFAGLLHDASEAFTNDISRPLKHLPVFKEFRKIEDNLQKVIYESFGLDEDYISSVYSQVKASDMEVFNKEVEVLVKHNELMVGRDGGYGKADVKIEKMSETKVRLMFMNRFVRYSKF